MDRFKTVILMILGALSAFFMLVIQRKNRKIEKQEEAIKQHVSKNEELQFINQKEQESKDDQDHIATSNQSDVDRMLEQNKAYRD